LISMWKNGRYKLGQTYMPDKTEWRLIKN
jgi:hypothetical protein